MGLLSRAQNSRSESGLVARVRNLSPRLTSIYALSIPISLILAVVCVLLLNAILLTDRQSHEAGEAYQRCQEAVDQLQDASDFLTNEARQYVKTGAIFHLDNYLAEIERYDRRGKALQTLQENATSADAIVSLRKARLLSDELAQTELYAFRLTSDVYQLSSLPEAVSAVELSDDDAKLTKDQKSDLAIDLMEGPAYVQAKADIHEQVNQASTELVGALRYEMDGLNAHLSRLVTSMLVVLLLLVASIINIILATFIFLIWPMSRFEKRIRDDEPLEPQGALELRHLIAAYNNMYAHLHQRAEALDHEANHDALTGAYNRGAFEQLLSTNKTDCALVLIDVDNFKEFNDTYGHDMGDAILVEVVATIFSYFRPSDFICRIGGDEFAVIMAAVGEGTSAAIAHKLTSIATFLRDTTNGLPAATISVGIAFGRPGIKEDQLFHEADAALYEAKRQGRDQYVFANELAK